MNNKCKAFLIAFLGFIAVSNAQITMSYEGQVAPDALYFTEYGFSPRITPHGDCIKVHAGYIFVTWYRGGMDQRWVTLSRKKIGEGTWQHIEFPHQHRMWQKDPSKGDSHNTIAVGICAKDNTVHMLYDMHAYTTGNYFNYSYSQKGAAVVPDSQWNINLFYPKQKYLVKSLADADSNYYKLVTYPGFMATDAGDLIATWRIGTHSNATMYLVKYDGTSWSENRQWNDYTQNAGVYGKFSITNGKMYHTWSRRTRGDQNLGYINNRGLYYAYSNSEDGLSDWFTANGLNLGYPVTDPEPAKIAEPSQPGDAINGGPTYAVTESGAFHAYTVVSGTVKHYYRLNPTDPLKMSKGGPSGDLYAFGDRVYAVYLSGGRPMVKSTQEGTHNWTEEFKITTGPRFRHGNCIRAGNDIFFYLMEDGSGDRQPIHVYRFTIANGMGPDQARYVFEGDAQDVSGSGRHATPINGAAFGEGIEGSQSLMLDGIDDYARVASYQGITGKSARTISAWVKSPGTGSNIVITSWGPNNVSGQQYLFGIFADGGPGIYCGGPSIKSNQSVLDNQWHHVAAVLPPAASPMLGNIQLYVDGVLQSDVQLSDGAIDTAAAGDLLIGAFETSPGQAAGFFAGHIDDLRLYNDALDAAGIAAVMDVFPPTPNPAAFERAPAAVSSTQVTMTAMPGTDDSGVVEYYFTCVQGGGADSDWQSSPEYTASGLTSKKQYSYNVKMRDWYGNETAVSDVFSVWTMGVADIDGNGTLNLDDLAELSRQWARTDCFDDGLCSGADISANGQVDIQDLLSLAESWLYIHDSVSGESIENDNLTVNYNGTWSIQYNASDHGGSMTWSQTAGNTAAYTFNGDQVIVAVRKGPHGGICDIKLDGVVVANGVDTYSASVVYDVAVYDSGVISSGTHTIELVVTGTKNPSSGSANIMFDYFYVVAPSGSIGISFLGGGTQIGAIGPAETAGFTGYEQSRWNVVAGGPGTVSGLLDSNGSATNVSVLYSADEVWGKDNIVDSPDGRLMTGWIGGKGTTPTLVTFSSIPYATYNLVVYSENPGSVTRVRDVQLVDPSDGSVIAGPYYYRDPADVDGLFFNGTYTLAELSPVKDAALSPVGNVWIYTGLTSPNIRVELREGIPGSAPNQRYPINAIQIYGR